MTFTKAYEKHYLQVYVICKAILKDSYMAEDATQETFLKLMKKWDELTDKDSLGPWLRVTATNTCRDVMRIRKREFPAAEIYADTQDEDTLGRELMAEAMEAVKSFPDSYKEIFRLVFLEGYRTSEIAEKLHLPFSTVKGRIQMCLRKLRHALK